MTSITSIASMNASNRNSLSSSNIASSLNNSQVPGNVLSSTDQSFWSESAFFSPIRRFLVLHSSSPVTVIPPSTIQSSQPTNPSHNPFLPGLYSRVTTPRQITTTTATYPWNCTSSPVPIMTESIKELETVLEPLETSKKLKQLEKNSSELEPKFTSVHTLGGATKNLEQALAHAQQQVPPLMGERPLLLERGKRRRESVAFYSRNPIEESNQETDKLHPTNENIEMSTEISHENNEIISNQQKPNSTIPRHLKSLSQLCQRFLALFPLHPSSPIPITLDGMMASLGGATALRRRLYDIVHVLEALDRIQRVGVDRYFYQGEEATERVLESMLRGSEGGDQNEAGSILLAMAQKKESVEQWPNSHRKWLTLWTKSLVHALMQSECGYLTLQEAVACLATTPHSTSRSRRLYDMANILKCVQIMERSKAVLPESPLSNTFHKCVVFKRIGVAQRIFEKCKNLSRIKK